MATTWGEWGDLVIPAGALDALAARRQGDDGVTPVPSDPISEHVTWARARGISPQTARLRASILRGLAQWLADPPAELPPVAILRATEGHLDRWITVRGDDLSPGSLRVYVSNVRRFYRWARVTRLRPDDPALDLESPSEPARLPRPLGDDAIVEALNRCQDATDRAILLLAAECGLRRGEIARLKWADVDLTRAPFGYVRVNGKTGPGVVGLSELARESLVALPHRKGPVVVSRQTGKGMTPDAVGKRASRILADLGSLHQLRHTAGTEITERDGIRTAQEVLRHRSPAQTAGYAAVRPVKAAAAVERASLRHRAGVGGVVALVLLVASSFAVDVAVPVGAEEFVGERVSAGVAG
jgi:integrase/recombinase XerD